MSDNDSREGKKPSTSSDSPEKAGEAKVPRQLGPYEKLQGRNWKLESIELAGEILWSNQEEISPEEQRARIGRARRKLEQEEQADE